MLTEELQPAVQQLVQRNQHLERENKELYSKVHELLAQLTALKSSRHKFQSDIQSYVDTRTSELESPNRELKQRLHRQKHQIESLREELEAAQAKISELSQSQIQVEKTVTDEQHSQEIVSDVLEQILSIRNSLGKQTTSSDSDPMQRLKEEVKAIQKDFLDVVKERDRVLAENEQLKQNCSDLETRVIVLQQENSTTNDCNSKFEKEREELTNAITSLRSTVSKLKESLVNTENEKKVLKGENSSLKIEISQLKGSLSCNDDPLASDNL